MRKKTSDSNDRSGSDTAGWHPRDLAHQAGPDRASARRKAARAPIEGGQRGALRALALKAHARQYRPCVD